jgi:eukaryotic-like serine/threonine-protein kinase
METSTDRTRQLTALTPSASPLPAPASPVPGQRTAPAPKLGLAWRIFLGIALVVAVVLAATLIVASTVASHSADEAVRVGLEQTGQRVSDMLAERRDGMLRRAQLFAAQPSFGSTVGGAIVSNDSATLLDQAATAADQIGVSWTQIIGPDGIRLVKSDEPGADHPDLGQSSLVSGPLEGKPAAGFGVLSDTLLFDAVAIRVGATANAPVLLAGRFVTDTLATAIGAQTGTDLVFYTVNRRNQRVLTVSPGKFGARGDVQGAVASAMMDSSSRGEMDAHHMMMTSTERREIVLGGRRYVGQHVELLSAGGREVGGFIALRDRDKELAGFYRLRNALVATGIAGILIAFLLSLIIARQIVRPVRLLAAATQRAADGDYAAEIPVESRDEIGTLAAAFRRLLADLRDKQSLVDFLQSPSSGRTVALRDQSVTPTMAMEAMGSMGAVLEPGQMLAVRYEIKSVLGVGGMGMVYKATDRELGETVAVKTLKPDMVRHDPSALDRFKSEIKLARRIAHRNVVRTYDLGENGGVYFITMEFVEGKSLKELILSRGRLPVSVALPIAKQLCRALEVAHEEGVIHRDIKPQNMVVQPDGVLKVMDFGIARLAQRMPNAGHTQAGMVVGTPEYMAPEQLFGEEIDVRADLYAAGAVIYECLTGRLPHEADTPMTLVAKVLEETPRAPRELQPDIPTALSDVILRTLSRERDKRPASASELHDWLDAM